MLLNLVLFACEARPLEFRKCGMLLISFGHEFFTMPLPSEVVKTLAGPEDDSRAREAYLAYVRGCDAFLR